jgi:secreted trypsin-like serine protease
MNRIFFGTLFTLVTLGSVRANLIGGAEQDVNNGVFHIAVMEKGSEDADVCTASKIGEDVIITAAHCFDFHKTYSILFSTDSKNPNYEFSPLKISKVFRHPSYKIDSDGESDFAQSDVAIVFIKSNAIFTELKTIDLDYKDVMPGTSVEIWGYGCQESMNKIDSYYPVKKSFTTKVEPKESLLNIAGASGKLYLDNANDIFNFNFMTPGKAKSDNEASVCFGDSGGPVLQEGKIVGINVEGFLDDMNEKGESAKGITYLNLHVRLSNIKNWIQETLKKTF